MFCSPFVREEMKTKLSESHRLQQQPTTTNKDIKKQKLTSQQKIPNNQRIHVLWAASEKEEIGN